jgi:hypothetical protein
MDLEGFTLGRSLAAAIAFNSLVQRIGKNGGLLANINTSSSRDAVNNLHSSTANLVSMIQLWVSQDDILSMVDRVEADLQILATLSVLSCT